MVAPVLGVLARVPRASHRWLGDAQAPRRTFSIEMMCTTSVCYVHAKLALVREHVVVVARLRLERVPITRLFGT